MTNPSSEFEKRLSEAAHEWVQKRNPNCDSAEHWYHEQMTAFKSGAHYGIGAVIDWLRSEDEMGSPASQRIANVIERRFQSGQARDGGK